MYTLRCTAALLHRLQAPTPTGSGSEPAPTTALGDWYANLLRIEGKKCVIFTSERTLLTFLFPGLSRDAIHQLPAVLRDGLSKLLESETFADDVVGRLLSEYQDLAVVPTTDRSVLGSLNELSRMAEAYVHHGGGLESCDLRAINHRLNQNPMSRLQMASPMAVTKSLLDGDLTMSASRKRTSSRKKKPRQPRLDEVRITRDGDTAVITH